MANILTSEQDLAKLLPITPRKLRKLRLSNRIPFIKVDRYTRLYDIDAVVAALQKVETNPK
jgi:hypothetical protein